MGLTRRQFLQRSSFALAAFGSSNLILSPIAQRYQQVLAEPTRRKLALLIGINQYRQPLYGCVTDVALQRELLLHRFGFQPSDILTLTDQQATREAIATAFMEHLIAQARSGDVVVFHFSGYGSRLAFSTAPDVSQKSLMAIDEPASPAVPIVHALLTDTLLLLLRSLPTDRVTTILDTSYTPSPQPLQGNLRLRSRPGFTVAQPYDAELALQDALLRQTNLDRAQLAVQQRSGQLPGVVLTAASTAQGATESRWHGFSAGLFTYALTQQLWQATSATVLRVSLRRATEQMGQLTQVQQPQLSGQKSNERPLMPYYLPSVPSLGADGVVVRLEDGGKTVQLWLGGLAADVLEQYEAKSVLTLINAAGSDRDQPQLQILSREGLLAKAKLHPARLDSPSTEMMPGLQVGQCVREQVRVLPRAMGLTIALASHLARIERVDAISAMSAIPHLATAIAGEQAADYLFGYLEPSTPTTTVSDAFPDLLTQAVSSSRYALFSPGQTLIPSTAGEGGEAVKAAVKRLAPKLQTLLAAKWLNLTVNEDASQLAVRATLTVLTPQERELMQRETSAIAQLSPLPLTSSPLSPESANLVSLPVGSQIQYRLENQSDRAVYFLLLHVDSNGDLISLEAPLAYSTAATLPLPVAPKTSAHSNTIAPHETLTLPLPSASFQWLVSGPTGIATTYLLCSSTPFKQTMVLLNATRSTDAPSLQTLTRPLEVVQALLQDLHQASSDRALPSTDSLPESFVLAMNVWATLRFVYQIV